MPEGDAVIFFPLDAEDTGQAAPKEILESLPSRISAPLSRAKLMETALFYRDSPIVKRALRERRLRDDQVGANVPPDAIPTIAREFAAKAVVQGSLSAYTFDRANNRVEMSLTLEVRELAPGGQTRVVAVSGHSKQSSVVSSEIALAAEAANDAAMNAAAEIAGTTVDGLNATITQAANVKVVKPKKKHSGRTALIIGAVALIAILASSNGGGHSSSTTGATTSSTTGSTTSTTTGSTTGATTGGTPPTPPF